MDPLHDHSQAPLRRSVLSVPGDNLRALQKVPSLDCDGIIIDLEDAVADERKAEARENVRHLFSSLATPGLQRTIRINPVSGRFGAADMDLVNELRPDAVVIPKVEHPSEVRAVSDLLASAGSASLREIAIWAMIETPKGVLNAAAIAEAGRDLRLECFVLGLNDLRKASGVLPEPGRTYLIPWLMQVVLAGRAHGVDILDSVFNDFRNESGLSTECAQGRSMGFSGKMLIHPVQIEPANRHFGPSPGDIGDAEAIVAAFSAPGAQDLNVVSLNGRMVERLHLEEAEKLLSRARFILDRKRKP